MFYLLIKRTNLKGINEFWIIRIGFFRKKKYLPFITLDSSLINNIFTCSNLIKLPFKSESCQRIFIQHFFKYFHSKKIKKVIKSWKKKLIPSGILKIQVSLKNNEKKLEKLKSILKKYDFFIENINKYDLNINGCIEITAINQKNIKSTFIDVSSQKLKEICLIISQYKKIFLNMDKIGIFGYGSKKVKNFLQNSNINNTNIQAIESMATLSNFSNDYFDGAIIANFFEYNNYSDEIEIFGELRRILKSGASILVIIPEKKNYFTKHVAQLFDKGIFIKKLDDYNIAIKWINLSSSFRMIQILIKNDFNFPLEDNKIKVLLLGVYSLRYSFLSNARWDSQARAFKKLGYNIRILDIKDNSFSYLFNYIKLYNPDILWIASKLAYDFLKKYSKFFKDSDIKVVYWLWDIITPVKFDFKGIIDYMFITSKGEIPLYKKAYNLDKIYYMPVSIMPEIIHRNKFIKEKYDVGFAGQISQTHPFYKERSELLEYIGKHFKVKIFTNIYNNISEYYCQCKVIFGGTPYFKDLELYASNRPYVALASGCCFIISYFKGLEKLAENEKHLLWFTNKDELKLLLDKYISSEELREIIRKNAVKLIKEKHNYLIRIQNMLDIVNGKTEDFYGFIN